jgi:NADH:ubiquinone oxidoreductase subunit E
LVLFIKEKDSTARFYVQQHDFQKGKRVVVVCMQQVGDTAAALGLGLVG